MHYQRSLINAQYRSSGVTAQSYTCIIKKYCLASIKIAFKASNCTELYMWETNLMSQMTHEQSVKKYCLASIRSTYKEYIHS